MPTATKTQGSPKKRRRQKSRYGQQLQEKQNLKEMFGIREQQLKRYYREALSSTEETGSVLVSTLERRLDNAIFRSGLAQTRPQARQMAGHRFFAVNGRSVDIPSYSLKPGDVVSVREGKRKASYFSNFEKRMQNVRTPSWMELEPKEYGFKVTAAPSFEEANLGIDIRAIVEFFAR